MRLVVLADDFTGAVDTGIQFAKLGIATGFYQDESMLQKALDIGEKEVYVMNTESRHLAASEAFSKIERCARIAAAGGAMHIMKKTDSGLRGNIGSELAGLISGAGGRRAAFIPAYPRMNRVTRQGIHYIDDVPVQESVFGKDPFEPVRTSVVTQLAAYDGVPAYGRTWKEWHKEEQLEQEKASYGIIVWDAMTQEDIGNIVRIEGGESKNYEKELVLWAGCAGLAQVLAEQFPFRRREGRDYVLPDKLLVVCGSVNEVTGRQVAYAERSGFARELLAEKRKLTEKYIDSEEGLKWLHAVREKCVSGIACIIDTGFPTAEEIEALAGEEGCSVSDMGSRTAGVLGELLCRISEAQTSLLLMIIGGDTLQAYMDRMQFEEIDMVKELKPGAVLLRGIRQGREQWIVTKSGGFGTERLLVALREELCEDTMADKSAKADKAAKADKSADGACGKEETEQ